MSKSVKINDTSPKWQGNRVSNVSLHALKRILYTSILIFSMAIASIAWTVIQAGREYTAQANESSVAQFQSLIHLQQDQLGRQVKDYAYWDDAIQHVLIQPDPSWWESNAGDYAVEVFRLSFALSIDGLNRPIFFSSDSATSFDPDVMLSQPAVLALIETVRRTTPVEEGRHERGIQGFIEIDGQHHLLAISAFLPERLDSPSNPDPEALLLFGMSLPQQLLPTTASVMGVTDMQVVERTDATMRSTPIELADGTRPASVQWLPNPATSAMWSSMRPVLIGVLVSMGAAMGYLIYRARQLIRSLAADASATHRLLAQQQSILETAADGIIGVDADGHIQLINQSALNLLKANRTENRLASEWLGDHAGQALRQALNTGLPWRGECAVDAMGHRTAFIAEFAIMPIKGLNQTDGAVITFRDISIQKSHEKALQLAQQVAEAQALQLQEAHDRLSLLHGQLQNEFKQTEAHNRTLEDMAMRDSLTGLGNRRSLQEAADTVARWAAQGIPYSVIMLDIDHFKAINDRHGHQHGDIVLTEVARCMSKQARQGDFAIRYGGEELLLILQNTWDSQAEQVAARIHAELHKYRPGGLDVTVSMGISNGLSHLEDLFQVINEADRALYTAKQSGRNQTVHFRSGAET